MLYFYFDRDELKMFGIFGRREVGEKGLKKLF